MQHTTNPANNNAAPILLSQGCTMCSEKLPSPWDLGSHNPKGPGMHETPCAKHKARWDLMYVGMAVSPTV